MNHFRFCVSAAFLVATAILLILGNPLYADWTITQTLPLSKGWNAVFLEIEPLDDSPDSVFAGLPIDKVLTYYPQQSSVQFIQNPSEIPFNIPGWHFWIPKDLPEYFLSNLYAIHANQAYLIHCTQNFQWKPSGTPKISPMRWQPDSYNLTGFHIDSGFSPSFSAYFLGVKAFSDAIIFYLQNGNWIRGPSDIPLKAGQAYWIYCKGGTDYASPLDVKLPAPGDGMDFGTIASEHKLVITNRSIVPVNFLLEAIEQTVPLSLVTYTPETGKTYIPFSAYTPPSALDSGNNHTIHLAIRRGDMASDEVKSLLKLTDSVGGIFYIPVSAQR